jgi:NAD(P)-dependent dehydrogenase (short-subunit alcohol dehydrogenase family)
MKQRQTSNKSILITGGTSGLGLELVKRFLREGYRVIVTGRQQQDLSGFPGEFLLYVVDFGDLKQVAETAGKICTNHSVTTIINNAGILSPPTYTETTDGLEYTFQVNFLAHLLIDKIILQSVNDKRPLIIASITSPVYRFAGNIPVIIQGAAGYSPVRSYSSSKLYLTMMHEFLTSGNLKSDMHCFSFDPGTFSSSIYRMQKSWFRIMYRVAAPFMRSPARVSEALADLLLTESPEDGMIYDISKRKRALPAMDRSVKDDFIAKCYELLGPFLR